MPEANEQQNEQSQEQSQQQQQAVADFLEITHGGKQYKLSKDDTIKYSQMGYDYTQKTQALSKEREAFKAEQEKFNQLVEQRALEVYRKALEGGTGNESENTQNADSELQKKIAELEQKLSGFENTQKSKEAEAQLESILSNLRKTYKGLSPVDEQLIMIRFQKEANDEADPNALFDQFAKERMAEKEKERQSVIDEYVKNKTKNPFSSGESGRSGTSGSNTPTAPKTWEEARARAEERLRMAAER